MKYALSAGAALLLTTASAYAGGLDRSGQGIGAIFQAGNYAELSFGNVSPDVTGVGPNASFTGVTSSGSVAPSYSQVGAAFKTQINDQIAVALIMDQPFGASVDYATAGYAIAGSGATVETNALTLLGKYSVNENISVYAGPRIVSASGVYMANDPTNGPGVDYMSTYSSGTDTGYVVGAAYEIPAIALRAALTYSSQTEFALDGTVGDLNAIMPQSVNFDFQTGIAADTLLMAGVRWADWSEATIDDTLAGNLADFNDADTYTYSIGVGRRFSEAFAASVMVSYEESTGDAASNLSPTDGYTSIQLGGSYKLDSGVEISGGIRYVMLGDATTETINAQFADNSATAVGIKIGYSF